MASILFVYFFDPRVSEYIVELLNCPLKGEILGTRPKVLKIEIYQILRKNRNRCLNVYLVIIQGCSVNQRRL